MSKEQILKEFIGEFCNDHNRKIRFLRGVFYDEQDGAERILNFISKAIDKTKKETREETIKEIGELFKEKPKRGRPRKIRPGILMMTKQIMYNSKAILDILNKLKN